MKTALVCGSRGFIGGHLVHYLRDKGYWVRGVDIVADHGYRHIYAEDQFVQLDLRKPVGCDMAILAPSVTEEPFDEVYQLAADMGGMGFIESHETDIMRNNMLINLHMAQAAAGGHAKRYFFSSSVCIYRDMEPTDHALFESDAYPAQPDNEYGWEKLYTERMLLALYRANKLTVRIARFQNTYGPYGVWQGGREKAPAALCRKAALCEDGGELEVWGDGKAIRCYTYIDDMVEGIYDVMQADHTGPYNLGTTMQYSTKALAEFVIEASGKDLSIKYVDGPVGVRSRAFSKSRIQSQLGWVACVPIKQGIRWTYDWVAAQVAAQEQV